MSAPQWKPGDMATHGSARAFRTEKGWTYADGSVGGLHQDGYTQRPLVVMDPDSPEDQRRLLDRLQSSGAFRGVVKRDIALDCIGDALRSLVTPPKPEEPQGLGAVVEDANGDYWVYAGLRALKDGETREWVHAAETRWYAEIAAVRVLSEGWRA